jgi:nicotinate-nucleotide adenylyltransferase
MDRSENSFKKGIFGGTFNPVHLGHIHAAEAALDQLGLDEIVFIPVFIPPHKDFKDPVSSEHRIRMLEKALEKKQKFFVSEVEIVRKGSSYTIDTLEELNKKESCELYFIMGSDSFCSFHKWYRYKDIKKTANLAVVYRPGFEINRKNLENQGYFFKEKNSFGHPEYKDISFIEVDGKDISSTSIREFVKNKKSINSLVDGKVADYIEKKGLYK